MLLDDKKGSAYLQKSNTKRLNEKRFMFLDVKTPI